MSDEDEKDIKLRDQFAMAAMQGIMAGTVDTLEFGDDLDKEEMEQALQQMSRFSYMVADAMRKARLISFK